MTNVAIRAAGLGKQYTLGARFDSYPTLRDSLSRAIRALAVPHTRESARPTFWALKDVSFDVSEGEIVGIVGSNGAGKSTLLKILSRVTEPTTGEAVLLGRVASLLEVGTGFHPELTGRENIFLNGAILGMRRSEIAQKFDEIVAFSEVERFIETPVKHYSSGMYLRLAFAVAAHLEADILFIDEVLAVGDAAFQQKCLGKMGEVARSGRTIIFVSHNLLAVERLCDRALWLHEGGLRTQGAPRDVIAAYTQHALAVTTDVSWSREEAPGTDAIRLRRARVRPAVGDPSGAITVSTPFVIEFEFWRLDGSSSSTIRYTLFNEHEFLVYETNPPSERELGVEGQDGDLMRMECEVPGGLLNNGIYRAVVSIGRNRRVELDDIVHLHFVVHDSGDDRYSFLGAWPGVIRPALRWRAQRIMETESP